MKKTALLFCSCVLLSACEPGSSITFHYGSGKTMTMSGAVNVVKDTVYTVVEAGSMLVGTVKSIQEDINERVDKVQEGTKKIQEGRDLIEEGLGGSE